MQPSTTSSPIEFYVALCLLLPLLSFFVSFLVSDRYAWAISFTSPFFQLISAFCACVIFVRMGSGMYTIPLDWFHVGDLSFSADLQLNALSTLMLPMVSIVAFLVQLYSTGYMAGSQRNRKYFAMLSFFTFAMLGLVLANNLLLLFVFWELVGFSSFVLIGHDNLDVAAGAAAKKAFLVNRIGDVAFLVGLLIVATHMGSLDLNKVLVIPLLLDGGSWKTVAALCLLGGVAGKSAQFPLFNWLPDAMAGPTPVSALIHAATMVAAGVFLLARIVLLFFGPAMMVVAIIGIITAVLAALAALAQTDLKKILAYSTISQLGLMVSAVGSGAPDAAILHLVSHACFKACLFLSAGSVIHVLHQAQHQSHREFDVQDIRLLGGLRKKMPITFMAFVTSGAALAGLPFTSGFLSKDAIFAGMVVWAQDSEGGLHWIFPVAAFAVSFITVLYTFRMIWMVFMGEEKVTAGLPVTEAPAVMRTPLIVLMAASLWITLSWNPFDFTGWLYGHLDPTKDIHVGWIVWVSAGWSLLALGVAYLVYGKTSAVHSRLHRDETGPRSTADEFKIQNSKSGIQGVLYHAFYIDAGYKWLANVPLLKLADATARVDVKWLDGALHVLAYAQMTVAHLVGWVDRAVVDGFVRFVAAAARAVGAFARSFQGGQIQLYIFWGVLTWIIFLIWMLV